MTSTRGQSGHRPPEAGRGWDGGDRAGGQRGVEHGPVVAGRRYIVRSVGVEQGGEVLEMVAAGTELAKAAAVHRDVVGRAVVVDLEQGLEACEPDRLDVDRAGPRRELLDVG